MKPPTLTELVEHRTIDGLVLSPDRKRIAYRVTSRSIAQNEVRTQWYSVSVTDDAAPIPLGGSYEPSFLMLYDFPESPYAAWAADSRSIYIRQVTGDQIQIHRIGPDGTDEAVTDGAADVLSFSVGAEGSIQYTVRGDRDAISAAQAAEQLRGIRMDRSIGTNGMPFSNNFKIGTRTTTIRLASASETTEAFAGPVRIRAIPLNGANAAVAPTVEGRVNVNASEGGAPGSPAINFVGAPALRLAVAKMPHALLDGAEAQDQHTLGYELSSVDDMGRAVACQGKFCRGESLSDLVDVEPTDDPRELAVFHQDGLAWTDIFLWNTSTGRSRLLRKADGKLDGGALYSASTCPTVRHYIICVHSGPSSPARLVRIDSRSGETKTLAAPNEALARTALPTSRPWHWRDSNGLTNTGFLTLPAAPAKHLPLVITSNGCSGFLTGGGMMAEEHLLVQRGFASLCVNWNNMLQSWRNSDGTKTPLWIQKSSVTAIASAIDDLAKKGVIDRTRVGIAGQSYGSVVAEWAISHTNLFAAAATIGNYIDATPYYIRATVKDSYLRDQRPESAIPDPDNDPSGIVAAESPAANAAKISAALLLQPPGNEYNFAPELFTRMQDVGGTVDMYIFPNEGHENSREPAHIYWRERRSVDWFSFWLKGEDFPEGASEGQYDVWRKLRADRDGRKAGPTAR